MGYLYVGPTKSLTFSPGFSLRVAMIRGMKPWLFRIYILRRNFPGLGYVVNGPITMVIMFVPEVDRVVPVT